MVKVERKDYKERTYTKKNGDEVVQPAWHECRYWIPSIAGRRIEIAKYNSRDDIVYLKSDFIGSDTSASVYQRAFSGRHSAAYRELFNMLGIDEKTHLSEYTNG